ncbi:hypothetical protein J6K35_01320 [bacterium]|nr:hypothetical protein [Lachnospiraceae bacterium]MBP3490485.1 hypothetical protein [bacterium]
MKEFQKSIVSYHADILHLSLEHMFSEEVNTYYKEIYQFLEMDYEDLKFLSGLEAFRITDLEDEEVDSLEF